MKALNQLEVELVAQIIGETLMSHQLQEIVANDRGLALGFHGAGQMNWLVFDLVPNTPFLILRPDTSPFKKGPKTKPVGLFLNSHGKGKYLHSVEVLSDFGRVVKFVLKGGLDTLEMELRLIPKQANLLVKISGKQISWEKPLPLQPPPKIEQVIEARSYVGILKEWDEFYRGALTAKTSLDPRVQWEKQKEKDLLKKNKALSEIDKQIHSQEDRVWSRVGQELKKIGSLDVSAELKSYVDPSQSLSWNIEQAFSKAKQLATKKEGARQRQESLSLEIHKLEQTHYSPKVQKNSLVDLMKKTEAKGRKLHLDSGAIVYLGKSGSDNLALLRQAKAWDLWVHLRDFPGAHAIIHKTREQAISEVEMRQVANWVAKESLATKSLSLGQKVEVIYVECRFVKPIKGDKLGRVNYHSEKSLLVQVD